MKICVMVALALATSMARYRASWDGEREGREDTGHLVQAASLDTSGAWDREVQGQGGEDEDTPHEVQNID